MNLTDKTDGRKPGIVSLFIIPVCLIAGFTIIHKLPQNETGELFGSSYNIVCYIIVIGVTFMMYLASMFLMKARASRGEKSLSIAYIIGFLAIVSLVFFSYVKEKENAFYGEDFKAMFIRENEFRKIAAIILCSLSCSILYYLLKKSNDYSLSRIFRNGFMFIMALAAGLLSYAPNAFLNQFTWFYHVHAYTNSIINVMRGVPYDDVVNGIYGHYGIIYYPFVKVLGDDFDAVLITIALFAFISYLAAFYVCNKLIKNDEVYLLTVVACFGISTTFFGPGNYYQIMPHRILLPMVTLAYMVWANGFKHMYYKILGGVILGTLAIVFSTEIGLCCAVTLVGVWYFKNWEKDFKAIAVRTILAAFYLILCFALAVGVVDVYNLICHGTILSVKQFIYPIGSDFVDVDLRVPVPGVLSWHTFISIVFCCSAFVSMSKLVNGISDDFSYMKLGISICGLTTLTYYINRCAPGALSVAHLQLLILLGIYASEFPDSWRQINIRKFIDDSSVLGRALISAVACFLISWLAIEGIVPVGQVIKSRTETVWDTEQLRNDYALAETYISEDVPAFGVAVQEIYYQIGIDPGTATSDWCKEDTTPQSVELVEEVMKANEDILISNFTFSREDIAGLLAKYGYVPKSKLDFQNFELVLFER